MSTGALRQLETRATELAIAAHGAGTDPTFEEIVQQVALIKDEMDGEAAGASDATEDGSDGGGAADEAPVAEQAKAVPDNRAPDNA